MRGTRFVFCVFVLLCLPTLFFVLFVPFVDYALFIRGVLNISK